MAGISWFLPRFPFLKTRESLQEMTLRACTSGKNRSHLLLIMNGVHKARVINTIQQRLYCTTPVQEWFPCTLQKKTQLNYNTYVFDFKLPEEKSTFTVPVGKHVVIKPIEEHNPNKTIPKRAYTPLLTAENDNRILLAVKVYNEGALTQFLSRLDVGQPILVKGPQSRFSSEFLYTTDNKPKKLVMIAGGSGITPMLQVKLVVNYFVGSIY